MITSNEILIRLLLGTLLGGIIGFERQIHGRPAGLRTHLLVCVASVLLMIVSEYYHYLGTFDPAYVRADPGRIAAGAITGVGFLGAGVILKTGFSVQGLTTAACLWIVSALGLAIGSGLYLASIATFAITLLSLLLLRILERRIPKLIFRYITMETDDHIDEGEIKTIIERTGSLIHNIDYEKHAGSGATMLYITISLYNVNAIRRLLNELSSLAFTKRIIIKS